MKIPGQDPIHLLESYLIAEKKGVISTQRSGRTEPTSTDDVKISETAKNYQQVSRLIASVPEVREDRVAEVQAKLDKGIDSFRTARIAEKLIQSTLLDAIL